jgi:Rrf2 family protein
LVITREADYAVRLSVTLAAQPQGTVLSARVLSAECDVPYELARTILGHLADAGILVSQRGRKGGFSLARQSDQVRLGEVLAAAGEPLALNVCVSEPSMCGRSGFCPVHPIWSAASDVLRGFLAEKTLAEILDLPAVSCGC